MEGHSRELGVPQLPRAYANEYASPPYSFIATPKASGTSELLRGSSVKFEPRRKRTSARSSQQGGPPHSTPPGIKCKLHIVQYEAQLHY